MQLDDPPFAPDLHPPVMLNLDRPYEEHFWCVLLEVDAAGLRAAVEAVGACLPAVCRYVLSSRQRPLSEPGRPPAT